MQILRQLEKRVGLPYTRFQIRSMKQKGLFLFWGQKSSIFASTCESQAKAATKPASAA